MSRMDIFKPWGARDRWMAVKIQRHYRMCMARREYRMYLLVSGIQGKYRDPYTRLVQRYVCCYYYLCSFASLAFVCFGTLTSSFLFFLSFFSFFSFSSLFSLFSLFFSHFHTFFSSFSQSLERCARKKKIC